MAESTNTAAKKIVAQNSIFSSPRFDRYTWPDPPKAEPKPTPFCWRRMTAINSTEAVICTQRSMLLMFS